MKCCVIQNPMELRKVKCFDKLKKVDFHIRTITRVFVLLTPRSVSISYSERPLNGLTVITALTARPLHNGNGRLEILYNGNYRYNGKDRY